MRQLFFLTKPNVTIERRLALLHPTRVSLRTQVSHMICSQELNERRRFELKPWQ